ncbi:MAG: ribonuclease P protein component [Prevotellaceae bacterium]|jgi:ribonuclease P protein component|nr:ribonuclease P protein component [Prevotellaceae bacterium]
MDYTFPKYEHLKGRKEVTEVFEKGVSIVNFPIRALYFVTEEAAQAKILVAASKKLFKKAVSRNYCKRLLREAYRLNKQTITEKIKDKNYGINIAFSYIDKEKEDFFKISEKISQILNKIVVSLP